MQLQPVAVALEEVTRDYQVGSSRVQALRGVSLEVPTGEFLGLVGVSGSGKSTLLHLLGGLDRPTSGRIIAFEQSLGEMSSHQRTLYRRTKVGFVFQSFYLIPTLSARQNVQLALTLQGVFGAAQQPLVRRALELVGLADRAGHRPGQLSGGEQQRVTVARAIVHGPPLLLADEPTGNLDQRTATSLMDLFRQLNREVGTTVVIVSHDERLLARYCDRIIRLADGQIVQYDRPPAGDDTRPCDESPVT